MDKANFRLELEQLLAYFGDKRVLFTTDVAKYTGRSYKFCKKYYSIPPRGISVVALARALS